MQDSVLLLRGSAEFYSYIYGAHHTYPELHPPPPPRTTPLQVVPGVGDRTSLLSIFGFLCMSLKVILRSLGLFAARQPRSTRENHVN